MEYLSFFYNVIVTVSFSLCSLGFYLLYRKSKNRRDLWISLLFLTFTIDNLVLYMREFINSFSSFYQVSEASIPFYGMAINLAILFCYRMSLGYSLGFPLKKNRRSIWVVFFLLVLTLTAIPNQVLHICLKMSLHIFSVIFFSVGLYKLFHLKTNFSSIIFKALVFFLITTILLQIISAFETLYSVYKMGQYVNYRKYSVEFLSLMFIVYAFTFLVYFQKSQKEQSIKIQYNFDTELIERFCNANGLTKRESEVLALLLKGYSNAEISKSIFISEGTVKVHSHNIYQKLDIRQRAQIYESLSRYSVESVKSN